MSLCEHHQWVQHLHHTFVLINEPISRVQTTPDVVDRIIALLIVFNNVYVSIDWSLACEIRNFDHLVQPVCDTNRTICGNGVCVNMELSPTGYTCTCNSNFVFNGTTCIRMYFFSQYLVLFEENLSSNLIFLEQNNCDNVTANSNNLLCNGPFQVGVDQGDQCVCGCRSGFTNSTNGCQPRECWIEKTL